MQALSQAACQFDPASVAHVRLRQRRRRHLATGQAADLPHVALPLAQAGALPVGVSLISGRGNDERLLALAVALENRPR